MHKILHFSGILFFSLLVLIAVGATLIPLIPSKEWYIRIFDYPRLQTFAIAITALAFYFWRYYAPGKNANIVIVLFLLVIIVQAYKVYPYTGLAKTQVAKAAKGFNDDQLLGIYISNVLQENNKYQLTLDNIKKYNPDLIITTETDSVWQQQLLPLHKEYPHRIAVPLSNLYGMHMFSKLPLKDEEVRYLIEPDIPSIRTKLQMRNGTWINLFVMHPRPPAPGEADDTEERDAEIITVAKEAEKLEGPVIVAGDFNDVAWSATSKKFEKVSGLLDPRLGRGFYSTYNAKNPFFRWPLDHIFHSSHFELNKLMRAKKVNSDHFPMYVQLVLKDEASKPEVKK